VKELDVLRELVRVKHEMQRYNFIEAYKILQKLMDRLENKCRVESYRAELVRELMVDKRNSEWIDEWNKKHNIRERS